MDPPGSSGRVHQVLDQRGVQPALYRVFAFVKTMVGHDTGRLQYNETINRTEDEQMLLSIVKARYGDTFSLLAVTGVAANVRFRTNTGFELGFGSNRDYLGNLVPFSGGIAYEENPTIT